MHARQLCIGIGGGSALPVAAEADVLVVGGGTAGVCAAIAAAREGARTLLIESEGYLGGSQTGALVTPIMNFHCGDLALIRGLHQEMLDRVAALPGGPDGVIHNAESLKLVYERMAAEVGVRCLYYLRAGDAVLDGPACTGVVAASKEGMAAYLGRVVVDATGDADIAHFAGVPCHEGRAADGVNQPVSLRFIAGGIDAERLEAYLTEHGVYVPSPDRIHVGYCKGGCQDLRDLWEDATARGELMPPEEGVYIQFFSMPGCPGMLAFNCPRVTGIRPTEIASLTHAATLGRERAHRILGFVRRTLPGCERAFVAQTAPLVGVRESRRIVGEHVLTVEDVLSARKFEDAIAKSCYPVDIHSPDGGGAALGHLPEGEFHDIPYRCLVPLDVEGLLVAGRCLSASFEAQAAVRVQASCRAFGEAAGVAAALCIERGTTPRAVDAAELVARLRARGAFVGPGVP
jgi:hypothetical protein